MNANRPPKPRTALALSAVLFATTLTGCQDVHMFVTGEPFYKASKTARRVEVEVVVRIDDTLFDGLSVEPDEGLSDAIADAVMSLADVGLRFYPILSSDYAEDDVRPPHVMTVEIERLVVHTDQEIVNEPGRDSTTRTSIRSLSCVAFASVEKRRADGPSLVIGHSSGNGRVRVRTPASERSTSFDRDPAADPTLRVSREELVDVIEEAAIDALREIVDAVDRDLDPGERP